MQVQTSDMHTLIFAGDHRVFALCSSFTFRNSAFNDNASKDHMKGHNQVEVTTLIRRCVTLCSSFRGLREAVDNGAPQDRSRD